MQSVGLICVVTRPSNGKLDCDLASDATGWPSSNSPAKPSAARERSGQSGKILGGGHEGCDQDHADKAAEPRAAQGEHGEPDRPNPPHRLAIAEGSVGRIHPGVSSGAQMNRADNRLPCRRALRLARPTLSGRASQDKTCAAVTAATDKQILARRMHPCNNCRIPGARPGKPEGYLPRSYRSSSITLVQAATKSFTKISFASELP